MDAHWRDPLTHLALTTHGFETLFQRIHQLAPRWLAVGGGGYDAGVVPRAWTLAWGVMSGQTFADDLPPAIAAKHSTPLLRDEATVILPADERAQVEAETQAVVAKLKELLKF